MHLDKKAITSAALATAAIATAVVGTVALVRKKRAADLQRTEGEELADHIGPGEVNPYADTPTDPANQN